VRKFLQTAVVAKPGAKVIRRTPVHPPTIGGQVMVPMFRAIVTGVLVGILVSVMATAADWPKSVPAIAGAFVTCVVWLAKGLSDKAIYIQEEASGIDLNGDGQIGKPQPTFRIEDVTRHGNATQMRYMDMPGGPERFAQWGAAILNGRSLGEARWTGLGRLYKKADYQEMRDELIDKEWAAWKKADHHASGWYITEKGELKLREWLIAYARTRTHEHTPVFAPDVQPAGEWGEGDEW